MFQSEQPPARARQSGALTRSVAAQARLVEVHQSASTAGLELPCALRLRREGAADLGLARHPAGGRGAGWAEVLPLRLRDPERHQ